MAGSVLFDKKRGKWYALLTSIINGKRKYRRKYGDNKTHARKRLDELRADGNASQSDVKTFAQLADRFAKDRLIEAKYIGGRKIAGRRELTAPRAWLARLRLHFSSYALGSVSPAEIEAYKLKLAAMPTKTGQRSIATINRELEFLRTMLNYAVANGWLAKNPFNSTTKKLIEKGHETKRERLLGFGEELALLDACYRPDARNSEAGNPRLKTILICAVDTGLRRNELFTLLWSDLDFQHKVIRVRAINAKANKAREVPMTPRVFDLLSDYRGKPGEFVFDGLRDPKRSFATACRLARITNLHFHDLRHAFVSRAILAGIPTAFVLKASGHASDEWRRYLNVGPESLRSLLAPVGNQTVEEVKAYASTVLKGLRAALHADAIEELLK